MSYKIVKKAGTNTLYDQANKEVKKSKYFVDLTTVIYEKSRKVYVKRVDVVI